MHIGPGFECDYAPGSPTLKGLSGAHAMILAAALSNLPGKWELAWHEGYDGERFLILLPEAGDETAPTFSITRDAAGLHLSALHHDDYADRGSFRSIHALLRAIRYRLSAPVAHH